MKKRMQNYAYKAHNKHLDRWLKKLKAEGSGPRVVILCVIPEEVADKFERRWIRRMRQRGFNLMNYTDGGEGAFEFSLESRKKLSDLMKNRWADNREKMMAECQSPEVAAKRASTRGPRSGRHNAICGERITKLNKSRRGVPLSVEHVEKVRQSILSKKIVKTPEERAAISERMKKRWRENEAYRAAAIARLSTTQFKAGNAEIARRGGLASHAKNPDNARKAALAAMAVMERDPKTGRLVGRKR
jgi:hypothetical protein